MVRKSILQAFNSPGKITANPAAPTRKSTPNLVPPPPKPNGSAPKDPQNQLSQHQAAFDNHTKQAQFHADEISKLQKTTQPKPATEPQTNTTGAPKAPRATDVKEPPATFAPQPITNNSGMDEATAGVLSAFNIPKTKGLKVLKIRDVIVSMDGDIGEYEATTDSVNDPLDRFDTESDTDDIDSHNGLYGMGDDMDENFHNMSEDESNWGHLGYENVASVKNKKRKIKKSLPVPLEINNKRLTDYSETLANDLKALQKDYFAKAKAYQDLHDEIHQHATKQAKKTFGPKPSEKSTEYAKNMWDNHYNHHLQQHPKFHELSQADKDRAQAKIKLKRATK